MIKETEFKETEIGRIPKDWDVKKIGDLGKINSGKKRPNFFGNYPVYGGNGISYYSDNFNFENQIIVGRVGAFCGNVYLEKEKFWLSDNALSFKNFNDSNQNYLFYLFKLKNFNNNSIGGAQPLITQKILKDIVVQIPPLSEQKAIAKILSDLDEKIEINKKTNENLENIGQTLFKQWFIDFEFPNEEGNLYKSSGGEMKESELGLIPKDWKVDKLENISEFKNGVNYRRDDISDSKYRVINVRNLVKSNFIIYDDLEEISIDKKKAEPYLLNPEKDILIVRSASPGEIGILADYKDNVIYSGFSIRCRINDSIYFYYIYFNLLKFQDEFTSFSNGTTLKNINQEILNNKSILMPNNIYLEHFNSIIKPIFRKIQFLQKEIKTLEDIRNSLLLKLMSGQIRVK